MSTINQEGLQAQKINLQNIGTRVNYLCVNKCLLSCHILKCLNISKRALEKTTLEYKIQFLRFFAQKQYTIIRQNHLEFTTSKMSHICRGLKQGTVRFCQKTKLYDYQGSCDGVRVVLLVLSAPKNVEKREKLRAQFRKA